MATDNKASSIVFSQAQTPEAIDRSLALVYQEYLRSGYIEPETPPEDLSFARFLKSSDAATFQALLGETLLGTISLIEDSPLGIPMDALYRAELEPYRRTGRIAEVSQFAVNKEISPDRLPGGKLPQLNYLGVPLFKLIFHCAVFRRITFLAIAVNPKHSAFYDTLSFRTIGKERAYASVNEAPAIAKVLDVQGVLSETEKLKRHFIWQAILENPPAPEVFKHR